MLLLKSCLSRYRCASLVGETFQDFFPIKKPIVTPGFFPITLNSAFAPVDEVESSLVLEAGDP